MKKVLSVAIAFCVMMLHAPIYANNEACAECEYDANEGYEPCNKAPLGYETSAAANSTISLSMVGWGLGLAIAIAIVAGVIHQSTASHNINPNTGTAPKPAL